MSLKRDLYEIVQQSNQQAATFTIQQFKEVLNHGKAN